MEKVDLTALRVVPLTAAHWDVVYDGGGKVTFDRERQEIVLAPQAPQAALQTFAALVLVKHLRNKPIPDYVARVEVTVETQLREKNPQDWEVFWFFGNYRLADKGTKEANYFILKPRSGTELGLAFDEVGQTFLETRPRPLLKIAEREELIFVKRGPRFRVYRDQIEIMDYNDADAAKKLFHHGGTFGLYSEDARVRIHSFSYQAL